MRIAAFPHSTFAREDVSRPAREKRRAIKMDHTGMGGPQEIPKREAPAVERRHGRRFGMWLSCRLCPVSREKVEFVGTVIDISRSGVLVSLDSAEVSRALGLDDVVRVLIELPQPASSALRCLECTAKVVRIIAAKPQTQVACAIWRMQVTD